jgi:predicted ATPase
MIGERLQQDNLRLLTLTGPGGVGKAHLALQSAADVADAFPDGVWFVDLAPVAAPDLVAPTIAHVLGVRDAGSEPIADRLHAYLRPKQLLLVLDNFEQVVAAAPFVAGLLGGCPHVTVLVTSRVRLRVASEREYAVPPLELVVPDGQHDVQDVARATAVRLFVERAQAVAGEFTLTSENAEAIAEICRRLDGLPLAIELAAARIKILPPAALLTRLERRLPVLTSGNRDLPARQQTMRNTLAWSYDLLSSEEQALFRRLSVFVGGFSLEAAEGVAASPQGVPLRSGGTGRSAPSGGGVRCADSGGEEHDEGSTPASRPPAPPEPQATPPEAVKPPPPLKAHPAPPEAATLQRLAPPERSAAPSVLDGIASLVDTSLLRQVPGVGGEPRYRMLETAREFGLEQLAASGEDASIREWHAGWYLELAIAVAPLVRLAGEPARLSRLSAEDGNLRAALG